MKHLLSLGWGKSANQCCTGMTALRWPHKSKGAKQKEDKGGKMEEKQPTSYFDLKHLSEIREPWELDWITVGQIYSGGTLALHHRRAPCSSINGNIYGVRFRRPFTTTHEALNKQKAVPSQSHIHSNISLVFPSGHMGMTAWAVIHLFITKVG